MVFVGLRFCFAAFFAFAASASAIQIPLTPLLVPISRTVFMLFVRII